MLSSKISNYQSTIPLFDLRPTSLGMSMSWTDHCTSWQTTCTNEFANSPLLFLTAIVSTMVLICDHLYSRQEGSGVCLCTVILKKRKRFWVETNFNDSYREQYSHQWISLLPFGCFMSSGIGISKLTTKKNNESSHYQTNPVIC